MRARRWIGLIVIVVIFVAIAVALRGRSGSGEPVEIGAAATRATFRSYVTASGEIVAVRFADVGSTVMGRVVQVAVAEGEAVRAGQTLAQIDPVQARSDTQAAAAQIGALEAEVEGARSQVTVAAAELEAARARALEARQALERAQQLSDAGLLPAAEKDSATAAANAADAQLRAATAAAARTGQAQEAATRRVAQARAQATRARDILENTTITAPIDGTVSRLQVREGEMVVIGIQNQPGTTLMTISDLSAVNAEVKVAEADVLRLKVGQPATVTLDAVPDQPFTGRVVEIGASALPVQGTGAAAREFRVVVRLDANTTALRPGLTCDAEILADEQRDVTTVPLQAVVLRPQGEGGAEVTGVFTVREKRAVFAPVKTGIIGGLEIEVSGLDAGTPVVVGPYQTLRTLQEGAEVRPAS